MTAFNQTLIGIKVLEQDANKTYYKLDETSSHVHSFGMNYNIRN